MGAVALVCALAYLALLGFKLGAACIAIRSSRRAQAQRAALPDGWMRDVAVLQPILSGDPLLESMLASNLLTLPEAQFVWLVDEDDAEAQRVTGRLQQLHATAHIQVLRCVQAPDGTNPKTFKLNLALAQTPAPISLVLDDDARLSATSLAQMVSELQGAELVTALPFSAGSLPRWGRAGVGASARPSQFESVNHYQKNSCLSSIHRGGSLFSTLLTQFINNNAALTYLPLLPLQQQPISINGMCYAVWTRRFANRGGFSAIQHQLADDLAVARLLQAAGARMVQSTAPVQVHTSVRSARHYLQQMHRWFLFASLLLRTQPLAMQALIALLHGLPPLLLWALFTAFVLQPGGAALGWLAGVLAVRALCLCGLQRSLTGGVRHAPVLSVLSELLQPLHLMHASLQRIIIWRKRRYRVHHNDEFHDA